MITTKRPVRIANCSGFYGDRLSAAREMVEGGPIDFLTGDWLAELTMFILSRDRRRDPGTGYAKTFVAQMEEVLGTCADRGIKVVANAGGLNPRACAEAVADVSRRLGVDVTIAYVEGDDLLGRYRDLQSSGHRFCHLETGEPLGQHAVVTANAYLGAAGIITALDEQADVVITGRCTDAALVLGPAAWHHRWRADDWHRLAGAVAAGHVIECGTQVTGGNYAFFQELPRSGAPGFPIAEVAADGSSVITKHPHHGGQVSIGTVTAQLLYEIDSPSYVTPDVVARFDCLQLRDVGPDRVEISGARGLPPPDQLKVCMHVDEHYRTTVDLALTGLDIEEKSAMLERALWASFDAGRDTFEQVDVNLIRRNAVDPANLGEATAELRISVADAERELVGSRFLRALTELGLATYPGFYGRPPAGPTPAARHWPTSVPRAEVPATVHVGSRVVPAAWDADGLPPASPSSALTTTSRPSTLASGTVITVPLGRLVGARSGDKGGHLNIGLWAMNAPAYDWLESMMTVDMLRHLLPDAGSLPIERYELPNVLGLNFVVRGFLGTGVSSSALPDPQGKSVGEYLRSRLVQAPRHLVGDE